MRLPSRLDLGLTVVKVRLVTVAQMRDVAECEDGESDTPDGLWDPDTDAIYILKALPNEQKRTVYWHEIKHMVNDADYWSRY